MKLFDDTFWWDFLMRHFDETFWWDILMKHFDVTFWLDILITHFDGIFWFKILIRHLDGWKLLEICQWYVLINHTKGMLGTLSLIHGIKLLQPLSKHARYQQVSAYNLTILYNHSKSWLQGDTFSLYCMQRKWMMYFCSMYII